MTDTRSDFVVLGRGVLQRDHDGGGGNRMGVAIRRAQVLSNGRRDTFREFPGKRPGTEVSKRRPRDYVLRPAPGLTRCK